MKRIVYPQRGTGGARAKVIARHVTVRHEPSRKFVQQAEIRRKQGFLSEIPDTKLSKVGPRPLDLSAHGNELQQEGEERNDRSKLPRLATYFDAAEGSGTSGTQSISEKRAQGDPNRPQIGARVQKSENRSAYEELRALWRRK